MNARSLARTATGAVAIVMATTAVAWGCSKEAIVAVPYSVTVTTVPEIGDVTVGPYSAGGYQESQAIKILVRKGTADHVSCGQDPTDNCAALAGLTVTGTNVFNDIAPSNIATVTIRWLHEPFFAASLGYPNGLAEHEEAGLCKREGVQLPLVAGTTTVTGGMFTATVNAPGAQINPGDHPIWWPGINAVCVHWTHNSFNVPHEAVAGGSFTIRPT